MEVDLKKLRNNVKSYISTKLEDSTYSSEIEVCEKKHSIDYKIVTDWISKN